MIAKFNTPATAPSGGSQGGQKTGGNGLVWLIVGLAAAFAVYKFVIKPMQEEQEEM